MVTSKSLEGIRARNPTEEVQKVEGKMDNMLEECWFFDNLLIRRTRYSSRSNADPFDHPSSSSSSNQQESAPLASEVYAEIIKQESFTAQETSDEDVITDKKNSTHKNRSALMRANHGLNRAPSLPVNMMKMEMKESCEDCVPPKASRLSRQTSLTPNPQPPQKGHAKGRISRTESLNLEVINEMRNGYMKYQKNTRKTASVLEHEEVQGFKDLGFIFDTSNLNPNVASILPGVQDKKKAMSSIDELAEVKSDDTEENVNEIRRNPYLSEAWQLQRYSSSMSNWVVRKSSEDMKAQLKSWARTVASNVR